MHLRWVKVKGAFRRTYWEGAPEFLFQRKRIGKPPDGFLARGQFSVSSVAGPVHNCHRTEHFDFSASDLTALNLDLGPMSSVSVTGTGATGYSFDLHAEITTDDEGQGNALLQRLALYRDGGTLVLKTPPHLEHVRSQTYLDILAPADRPVVITGTYTAVELFGINGPVTISTSHGSIRLIDVSGRIDASASEGGSMVFASNSGRAHLSADLGIDIRIQEQNYDGSLEATARGPVRVRVPRGFVSSFEANVRNRARFTCRVELGSPLQRGKDQGRITVQHGSEHPPQIRFISLQGPVVIDRTA